jgi:hypothetical protein
MFEKKITQFEREVLLQEKRSSKTSLKNFLIFKKAYSERLQKSIVGLENRIYRIKKMLYTT